MPSESINSRQQQHAPHDWRNIRLIAPKRPGYGASDMRPAHSVSNYAKDITQLADYLDTLVSFERTMMFLMRKTSVLIPHLGRIVIKALKRDPDMYLERFGKELCEPDKQVFETEEHRKIFRETFANIMPENVEGFLDSYFTPLYTWDFDPGDIQVPVQLWHGIQDQRSSGYLFG